MRALVLILLLIPACVEHGKAPAPRYYIQCTDGFTIFVDRCETQGEYLYGWRGQMKGRVRSGDGRTCYCGER